MDAAPQRTRSAGARLLRPLHQMGTTARNVAEVVRFGGLRTAEESAPYVVEAEHLNYRLRHYYPGTVAPEASPVLLIPPLMLTCEVWDIAPSGSAVTTLHDAGIDAWVVDFGDPNREPGGLNRTVTDHVLAASEAVDRVYDATGNPVVLGGYSQGGMFAYQVAALRRGKHIDSLVTFGSPADITTNLPSPLSPDVVARVARGLVGSGLVQRSNLPSWAVRGLFNMIAPVRNLQSRAQFLLALHDRDALLPRERQRRFLESDGFTAWAGPAIAELLEQFIAHNRLLDGGFVIDDRLVTLADIEVPVLTVVGTTDTLGRPESVRAIRRAAPRAPVYELTLRAGHFGLVVGSQARDNSWPAVVQWVRWREGVADLPSTVRPAEQVETSLSSPREMGTIIESALGQAVGAGVGVSRLALEAGRRMAQVTAGLITEAPVQLPLLSRLGSLDSATRISAALLLDEQAAQRPSEVLLLFGDRAYRRADVKQRIDSVVRGLISIGVRHGDRVGVLMSTRPSGFTTVAALNRLGATAVLLRPDGDPIREAELGRISVIVSDPDHLGLVDRLPDIRWAVLGGGLSDRQVREDVVDLERIDAGQVELPAWYRPNPQRVDDVAFVLFVGEGETIRAIQISNRRWAMSALGTASVAVPSVRATPSIALRPCTTPLLSLARRAGQLPVGLGSLWRASETRRPSGPRSGATEPRMFPTRGPRCDRSPSDHLIRPNAIIRSGCSWVRVCRAISGGVSWSATPAAVLWSFMPLRKGQQSWPTPLDCPWVHSGGRYLTLRRFDWPHSTSRHERWR